MAGTNNGEYSAASSAAELIFDPDDILSIAVFIFAVALPKLFWIFKACMFVFTVIDIVELLSMSTSYFHVSTLI